LASSVNTFSKYLKWSWLLLLVPIYVFIFLKIGSFHVRLWDESWFAVHAYEMLEQGSLLVPYFDGHPVIHGTKPPLQSWLQMISISLFGYSEMSLRLPSAMAAAVTVVWVYHFMKSNVGILTAWISAMVLLTTNGFIHYHAARGMEADSLLTLTLFAQAVFIWRYIKTNKPLNLAITGLLVGVSFWVKGVAGFLLVPALLASMIYTKKDSISIILKSPFTYGGIFMALGLSAAYMLIRESLQPGYYDFVLDMQAGRAIADVGHDQSFGFYYDLLVNRFFGYWIAFGVAGLFLPFLLNIEGKTLFKFSAIITVIFLLTISAARSKLQWYTMPVYPFLAIITAGSIAYLFQKLDRRFALIFLGVLFWYPSIAMFHKAQNNKIDGYSMVTESQEDYLYNAYRNGKNLNGLKVLHTHFSGALLFYKYKFEAQNQELQLRTNSEVEVNDIVLVRSHKFLKELDQNFELDTLDDNGAAFLLKVGISKSEHVESELQKEVQD
jgi:4-amino-4-deoxy-L-arabinose transferase-like glycosyltransferase